jgi:Carboxypeptidase regulatory-like domain
MKFENFQSPGHLGGSLFPNCDAIDVTGKPNRLVKKSKAAWATMLAILMAVVCGQIFAQAGIDMGSVTGTVKDQTGALVQKAQCALTNESTGVTQQAVSTSAGAYSFSLVPVGTYSMKVVAAGFRDYDISGIVVHLGDTVTEDVALQVGAASAEVTVTSAAPLLQAQDASLGMTITNDMATELPIFGGSGGRNFMQLATLAPGVQFTGSNLNTSTFLINSVQSGDVDVRLNGQDDNAEVFGGITIPPIIDAIQEFKIETGDNSAELGEFYGSVVNVVTKAGTNQFQGEAWEYNENDMYNANDYFNKLHELVTNAVHTPNRPAKYKENSFGGIFGGPVMLPGYNGHKKTFFTVDYQRTQFLQEVTYTNSVPTPNMQNSNFTNLSDTLTLNYQPAGGSGNPLSSEKQDAEGRYFQVGMMLDPATTRAVPCGSPDPITGIIVNCNQGYVVTNPNNIGGTGSTQKYGIVRDPFLTGGGGCPSLAGTMNFNSAYNTGNSSQPTYPVACFNQLPAGRIDPNAIALLKLFPNPNQTNASSLTYANNFSELLADPYTTQQYDVRIDHTISLKDSVLGTFSHYNQIQQQQPPYQGVLEGGGNAPFWTTNPTYMVVLTETHVFNPSLVNEFRAGDEHNWNTRLDAGSVPNTYPDSQYGIQGVPELPDNGGLPVFSVGSSIAAFGSRVNITFQKVGAFTFSDNLTKIAGRHEWKFGGEYNYTYGNISQLPTSRGSFTYNGQYSNTPNSGDSNTGLADFLLLPSSNLPSGAYTSAGVGALSTATNEIGGVSSFSAGIGQVMTYHAGYTAFYAIDTWKITPAFTANLGMRYEYFPPYSSNGGAEANFWMGGTGNTASGSALYVAHDGCAATKSPYFLGLLAYDNIPIICQPKNNANEMPLANWAPRLGFAYRITPRLVARAGGGIAYGAFSSIGGSGTLGTNYPWLLSTNSGGSANAYTPQLIGSNNVNTTTATMENTFGVYNITNALSATLPTGGVNLYGKQYHYHVPHVTTFDVALQWQFTNHDSIQATYVGNLGKDLDSADPYHNAPRQALPPSVAALSTSCANAANPYCATSPLMPDGTYTIPFPNLAALEGPMDITEQISNYQSAQAEYQHQFAAGFNMDANYTFGRCWSDAQGGQQNEGGPANGRAPWVVGFGGYRADYDRCESFAANVFKLSGEYNLPFGKGARFASNANAAEDAIIGGWKIDPVWIASSGILANVPCEGTNGQGANPAFTGPWFQTGSTAWACDAPLVSGVSPYGPGAKDHARTRTTGYFNTSAFTAPQLAVQTIGQQDFTPWGVRGNQIYGPGWYDVDASVHKQFKITEATKVEIQAQALNAFNHVHLNNPCAGGSCGNYTTPGTESLTGGFGTITGDSPGNNEGRVFQFAGKLFF